MSKSIFCRLVKHHSETLIELVATIKTPSATINSAIISEQLKACYCFKPFPITGKHTSETNTMYESDPLLFNQCISQVLELKLILCH